MKAFALGVAILSSFAQIAAAAMTPACVPGTLTDYIALGSGGCYIGNDQLNSFQTLSNLAGATPISPASISVTPSGSDTNPTLTFNLNSTAPTGSPTEVRFTYRVGGTNITGSSITLSGTSVTGDGGVTDAQNICRGGTFGADGISGCTGTPSSLVVLNSGADATTFPGVGFLKITDDLTIDAGLSGTASGAHFVDQFTASAVPEPSMIPVLLSGLGLAAYFKRRSVVGAVSKI